MRRTPPGKIVERATRHSSATTWYDLLPQRDRKYVNEVVAELRKRPGVALYTVAEVLIAELSLNVKRQTVYTTLKELLNATP